MIEVYACTFINAFVCELSSRVAITVLHVTPMSVIYFVITNDEAEKINVFCLLTASANMLMHTFLLLVGSH